MLSPEKHNRQQHPSGVIRGQLVELSQTGESTAREPNQCRRKVYDIGTAYVGCKKVAEGA